MYVTQFLSPRNKDTPPDDPVFPPSAEASAHSHCSLLSHTGISDETCIPSADVLQRQPHLSKRLTFLPAVPDLQPVLPILPHKYHNILEVRDFSTNDYMLISDMLITDYSSVIFEYALLGKPIAFFCYDLLRYDRDFYLKYPDDLPGDVFKTQEELTEYLRNPEKHVLTDKYTYLYQLSK